MTVIDQRAARRIQLACIAGKSRDGFYELRYALGGGRGMAQRFVPVAEPRSLLDAIARQARNSDVYIGAAPRRERRGTAGAIKHVWSLWVDCDGRAATNALERFLVRPTLVIRTGSGQNRHAWWALRDALRPEQAQALNRRVAHKLGGDARGTDPARILRPAGTLNHKHAPAEPVIAVRAGCDVYTADEVAGDLADPPEEALARNIAAEVGALRHDDPLRWIPASEYVVALTGRPIGRDGKVRCPWHAGGEDRTPSLQAYDDPARGWMGFGCDAGGSIIDFGARLYGIRPRGRGYHEVRQRLARELRARAVAA